jgi:hypothetical protein
MLQLKNNKYFNKTLANILSTNSILILYKKKTIKHTHTIYSQVTFTIFKKFFIKIIFNFYSNNKKLNKSLHIAKFIKVQMAINLLLYLKTFNSSIVNIKNAYSLY